MTVEGHIDLRELAGRLARRRRGRTEATVQADVRMLLLASGLNLTEGDVLDVELEAQLADRRREGPQEAHPRASLGSAPILIRLEEASTDLWCGKAHERSRWRERRRAGGGSSPG